MEQKKNLTNAETIKSNIREILSYTRVKERAQIETILEKLKQAAEKDGWSKTFIAISNLLHCGFSIDRKRKKESNRKLQAHVDQWQPFSLKRFKQEHSKKMDNASTSDETVLSLLAPYNLEVLNLFNQTFRSGKERLYAQTVNFVSAKEGASAVLETIYYADKNQEKELVYLFLKKVFNKTYDVVQQLKSKSISYPLIFKEPLREEERETEQEPSSKKGGLYLCHDGDIGNLYSYMDGLASGLISAFERDFIKERQEFFSQEKKKYQKEGYITNALLITLILKYNKKEDVLKNMVVKHPKFDLKVVLLEFIKTLQTNPVLFRYSMKRSFYLKHYVIELLEDQQLAKIPNFYMGMVIAAGLLSNEQLQPSYGLIEKLLDEKSSFRPECKDQLALCLNEMTPTTIDSLVKYIIKGSYLIASKESKKILEKKFEEAKALSMVQDPLNALIEGLVAESGTLRQCGQNEGSGSIKEEGENQAGGEKKFLEALQTLKKWWVRQEQKENKLKALAFQLNANKNREILKDNSPETLARLRQIRPAIISEQFCLIGAERFREKIYYLTTFESRKQIFIKCEKYFKQCIEHLFLIFEEKHVARHLQHHLDEIGIYLERCLLFRMPLSKVYHLPARDPRKQPIVYLGVTLMPFKKKTGSRDASKGEIQIKPHLLLFQEVPHSFANQNTSCQTVQFSNPHSKKTVTRSVIEIPFCSHEYYLPILHGFKDILQRYIGEDQWNQKAVQHVVGAIKDYQQMVESESDYGVVGEEMLTNPARRKKKSA